MGIAGGGCGCPLDAPRPPSNDQWDLVGQLTVSSLYLTKNQTYCGLSKRRVRSNRGDTEARRHGEETGLTASAPRRAGRDAAVCRRPTALQRPQGRRFAHVPAALGVHVVYVWESIHPRGGAVEWRLITSEPIDTFEQVRALWTGTAPAG